MATNCPRCGISNPDVARFCRRCGLVLKMGARGPLGAGRAPHRDPLPPPEGFEPIGSAKNLHFRWQVVGGGTPLLGTEPLELSVFNGGYGLKEVVLRVIGLDESGSALCQLEREISQWQRGATVTLEIASYDLPDRVRGIGVELIKTEFAEENI